MLLCLSCYKLRTDNRNGPVQGLRLHLDYSGTPGRRRGSTSESLDYAHPETAWASAYTAVAAGAALAASLGLFAFLRRSSD